jgi:hypothetical protein
MCLTSCLCVATHSAVSDGSLATANLLTIGKEKAVCLPSLSTRPTTGWWSVARIITYSNCTKLDLTAYDYPLEVLIIMDNSIHNSARQSALISQFMASDRLSMFNPVPNSQNSRLRENYYSLLNDQVQVTIDEHGATGNIIMELSNTNTLRYVGELLVEDRKVWLHGQGTLTLLRNGSPALHVYC